MPPAVTTRPRRATAAAPVLTIDQMRDVAADSGRLVATTPPAFARGPNGQVRAEVAVTIRLPGRGLRRVTGRAYLDGVYADTAAWRSRPRRLLGECAEAAALRGAFPGRLSGTRVAAEPLEFLGPPSSCRVRDALAGAGAA